MLKAGKLDDVFAQLIATLLAATAAPPRPVAMITDALDEIPTERLAPVRGGGPAAA